MATPLMARQGRHRQLYEDNRRLVSGCIPYRLREGRKEYDSNIEDLEVLMISSPNRSDLVFPKGGWENDETVEEAACREAFEEAGVRGKLSQTKLGVWEFRSKSRQDKCTLEGGCRGHMFAMKVEEELDTWPEQENHGREWLNINEATKRCRYEWMKEALRAFHELMLKEMNVQRSNVTACNVIPDQPVVKPTTANYSIKSNVKLYVEQRLYVS